MTLSQNIDTANQFGLLFEKFNDPVVEFKLYKGEPTIIRTNETFREVFCEQNCVVGHSLDDIIAPEDYYNEANVFREKCSEKNTTQSIIKRNTSEGCQKFLYSGILVSEDHAFAIYSNITEYYRQEQQLNILQYLIRHKLRNDINTIIQETNTILNKSKSEEIIELTRKIYKKSNELANLGTKSQIISKTFTEPSSQSAIDIKPILKNVSADIDRRFKHSGIAVECADSLTAQADQRLQILIENLADNAIRHNTSSTPEVFLSARAVDDDFVKLTVADNGPGIPKTEQQVITAEEEISSLTNASGFGLWIVRRLTKEYNGSIDIETAAVEGSIVKIYLPKTV